MKIIYTMRHKDAKAYAEIDEKGMTRLFDNKTRAELPMHTMDNMNPIFAKQYLEFRGWVVVEARP